MIDLSIVIASFNTEKLTRDCLESVFAHTKGIKIEIIVVDNASKDGSVKILKTLAKKHPLTVIVNKKNVGFGQGNNQGIFKAKGKYILLLNTDTIISDNVLGEMVEYMDKSKDVGVATCALKFPDGSLQGTGGYFPTLLKIFFWMFFIDDIPGLDRAIKPFHPMHPLSPIDSGSSYFEEPHDQDWITGAFFLVRAEIIKKVGGFDKDYFMYVEEVDLCKRIKNDGWKIKYLPKWSIIHLGGASSTAEFPILNEIKSLKVYYKKQMPSWQMPIMRALMKTGSLMRMIVFGILKGKEAFITYAKAFKTA